MGVPKTEAMMKARELLAENPGCDRKVLAAHVGLTRDALYKDAVCAAIIKQHRESKQTK